MKNKKTKIAIIAVIALVLVTIGITYAYWLITRTQEGENVITTGCLDIALSGENDITLSDQFPISDEEGMTLTPYTFTVTNNCNTSVDYHINLESIGDSSNSISSDSLKVVLNTNTSKKLYDYVEASTTISDAYEAYTLGYGTLSAKDTEGSTVTYNLRLWIDENASISEMNKTYTSRISVNVGQGVSAEGATLASLILADAETNGYLKTEIPDFSQTTADGEYGLYSAADDLGTSYYFRGDVENNYVKFNQTATTYYVPQIPMDLCGDDENCKMEIETINNLAYLSLESCDAYMSEGGVDGECAKVDASEVFIMPSDVASLLEANTNIILSETFCDALVESAESTGKCARSNGIYWRIIRINGDGTIRLIYDGISAKENGSLDEYLGLGATSYNTDTTQVGYTYDDGSGTQVDSTVKTAVDTWYENNLKENYGKYIADEIFCNDKEIDRVATSFTFYKGNYRVSGDVPELTCNQEADRYTVKESKGNGYLKYPVGLITADEIVMASEVTYAEENIDSELVGSTYLRRYDVSWTMTPYSYANSSKESDAYFLSAGIAYFAAVNQSLYGENGNVSFRPVINLKADVQIIGDGTVDSPYEIVTE